MNRGMLAAAVLVLSLAACGDDEDGAEPPPADPGTRAEYFPLAAGDSYLYRRNGEPAQTTTLTVREAPRGLLEMVLESPGDDFPRVVLLTRVAEDRVEVLRLDRGALRLELDPPLGVLEFPLLDGHAYTGSTKLELFGLLLGVTLFGTSTYAGTHVGLTDTYERVFAVEDTVQTDLLGQTEIELLLAPGLGPVDARVVSPVLEMLGISGLELHLELLEAQR